MHMCVGILRVFIEEYLLVLIKNKHKQNKDVSQKIYSSVKVSAIGTTTIKNKVRPRSVVGLLNTVLEIITADNCNFFLINCSVGETSLKYGTNIVKDVLNKRMLAT